MVGMEMNDSAVILWGGGRNDNFHLGCQICGLRRRRC